MPHRLAVATHQLRLAVGIAGQSGFRLHPRDGFGQFKDGGGAAGLALAQGDQALAQVGG